MKRFMMLFMVSIWAIAAVEASAQSYPAYDELYVNDFAGVLSAAEQNNIRGELMFLNNEYGVEMTVVTIPSYGAYNTGDASFEAFATGLFNAWGVGDAQADDGVMILYSDGDRMVRIEVGNGYENRLNRPTQQIIDDYMIPQFRAGNTGDGIIGGVTAMVDTLQGMNQEAEPPPAFESVEQPQAADYQPVQPSPQSTPQPTVQTYNISDSENRPGGDFANDDSGSSPITQPITQPIVIALAALGGTGVLGGGAVGYRRYVGRYRRRKCPQCDSVLELVESGQNGMYLTEHQQLEIQLGSIEYDVWACPVDTNKEVAGYPVRGSEHRECDECNNRTMVLLDEQEDDLFLTDGQRMEEVLGSVNYNVYRCVIDNNHTIEPRKKWITPYKSCERCGYKTAESDSRTVQRATERRTGLKEVTEQCRSCGHFHSYTVTIPRIQSDSGSSSSSFSSGGGSSFGGGSSSGGGSSGSW